MDSPASPLQWDAAAHSQPLQSHLWSCSQAAIHLLTNSASQSLYKEFSDLPYVSVIQTEQKHVSYCNKLPGDKLFPFFSFLLTNCNFCTCAMVGTSMSPNTHDIKVVKLWFMWKYVLRWWGMVLIDFWQLKLTNQWIFMTWRS